MERTPPGGARGLREETAGVAGVVNLVAARANAIPRYKIAEARRIHDGEEPNPKIDRRHRFERPEFAPVRTTADRLADLTRLDQREDPGMSPVRRPNDDRVVAARHLNLALRAGGLSSTRGWFAVLQQLNRVVRALEKARAANADLAALRARSAADMFPAARWVNTNAPTEHSIRAAYAPPEAATPGWNLGRPARPTNQPGHSPSQRIPRQRPYHPPQPRPPDRGHGI